MTDADLIAKKLALIETYVEELRTLGKPNEIASDRLQERFIEHTLQIAIQAAIDVASHIVSDERLGEPATYRDLFELLVRHEWISDALVANLREMVGFRNVVVHGYSAVDLEVVRDVAENHLGDLLDFVAQIRRRL